MPANKPSANKPNSSARQAKHLNNARRPAGDDLARLEHEIEFCEPRLALSASLAADWLLELASIGGDNSAVPQDDLFAQAKQLREIELTETEFDHENSLSDPTSGDAIPDTRLDGRGQTIAVIDSGVAWDHVSLGAGFGPGYRVVGGWDFAENDDNPYDDGPSGYHGTHVASLIGGQSEEFVGIAPESDLVALRVFNDNGVGELEWVESALQWVHDHQDEYESPITTVNLSLGATLDDTNRDYAMNLLEDELAMLREDGILVFAAAGNQFASDNQFSDNQFSDSQANGSETVSDHAADDILYPASSPSVIPVSSIGSDGELSDFAQRQNNIFAAPGEAIKGGVPEHVFGWDGAVDDFALLDGTSMATPQVAAISMLVRQSFAIEGIEPSVNDVLDRMEALSNQLTSELDGISYQTFDLTRLADFLPQSVFEEPAQGDDSNIQDDLPLADRFDGTNENEILELDLRSGADGRLTLRVGDQTYSIDSSVTDSAIVVDAHGGSDRLTILGSESAERLVLHADQNQASTLSALGMQFEFRGFESVEFVGGGGPDRASLFDSAGDDTLTSHPAEAKLAGVGFQFDVIDVKNIFVHGTGGGNDQAFIHDSDLDDQLAVRPQFTSLRNDENFQLAFGFEKVFAYSNSGGDDSIEVRDSEGDDTLSVSAARSIIVGPGYQVTATGFASIEANSTAGGNDVARIYADTTDARWESSPDRTQWTDDDGFVRIARGFEQTETFESNQRIELAPQSQPIIKLSIDDQEDDAPWWLADWHPSDPSADQEASRKVFEDFGKDD